ncbi:MAG: single-stranded DNA-binding protein [Acutalibacteraceae bacterium]|nr:single-stranded DNA-binding protein [Acutalibacteraceae bacterium]
MSSLNKVILIGRLGQEPKIINNQYATFSLATSETWKDKATGEKKEATEWHNIFVANQNLLKVIELIHKGSLVYLEGKIRTRDNNGQKMTDIVISQFDGQLVLLESKK